MRFEPEFVTLETIAVISIHAPTPPRIFVIPQSMAIGAAISDLRLLAEVSDPGEWENQVVNLPLR